MTEELNIKELFTNFVNFISRNNRLISFIVLIGIITVVVFQKFKTPYFETKAICMSGISEYERVEYEEDWLQRTAIDLINYLEINIENKDYLELSDLLGVDLVVAKNIKKIEAEQLYQKDMNEEFFTLNKFEIMLTVFDNKIIEDVQKGLIYYFSNNEYVSDYARKFNESSNQIIIDINHEMKLLEKIRIEGAKNSLDVSSSLKVINGQEKSGVSNQIILLSKFREEIKTKKELLHPLSFVQNFAKVNKREDDVLVWGLLAGCVSFLLGLLVALIIEVKKD
jgi:hypothetical protein|tara:strand:- start:235 stop:1077 length:843 start_codon:yes stop_codon:yes gene_type:complete